jgi:hypothetical protein
MHCRAPRRIFDILPTLPRHLTLSMSNPIYSDDELAQQQQFQEDKLRILIELEAEDVKNWPTKVPRPSLTSNAYRIGLRMEIVKKNQRERIERAAEDKISDDDVPEISVRPLASPQPTALVLTS